ncbi:MAG: phosphoribosylformylglycinamidine synthase [Firmicutes bacterium]|nr:phosphoribosylformylglycinamidine synthase [Bacillota bacterium]
MVYRIYVEKKKELANEAKGLLSDIRTLLGIERVTDVRIINRYDVDNIEKDLFDYCVGTVFSEPQLDNAAETLEGLNCRGYKSVFAVESLPGQFDQRADSAAQCIQIISQGDKPLVRCAKVYALYGDILPEDVEAVKSYIINPVETREAELSMPETLEMEYEVPQDVAIIEGFIDMDDDARAQFIKDYGLAMDTADLKVCQDYFVSEQRNPTITEVRMIDTYWSDHCRHTTFGTVIDEVTFEDELLEKAYNDYLAVRKELGRTKPICMMDLATLSVKYLKTQGKLDKLDESEEINACTVKITVTVDGERQPWLLLFKNETHNHPTEIEPFGGAATCVGGCIRDPLSGRSYVYAAMRLTGAGNPLQPVNETLEGKLPQRTICQTAAAGYSSYGNQIGLATGMVDEIYHPGYVAKRMEVGAVIAAAPAVNVRRERPAPTDVILLLGGSTGRDGIGGATGSSKAHDVKSVETCGAEVQKGNAPEERKIQRLFRNGDATRMIKKCNDFGAGGVSVAIGELADGLDIDLNAVPKKYEGLDGTELAIAESQERMACVVAERDVEKFMELAANENLQCVPVAVVTERPYLTMRWNGKTIVDISREFLDSNGADKHITIAPEAPKEWKKTVSGGFAENYIKEADDLNICSKRGLSERFDSTIGAGSVLMPFGGKNQLTPIQAMVHKIPLEKGHTDDCSFMSWGYNPFISEKSPYHGAYLAVVESVSKLIATGASFKDTYLSFQEFFESPRKDPKRWGKPFAALLGAFEAQLGLGVGSIGGKDSMSGSFENIDVPPTLISFAVTTDTVPDVVTPEFKEAGHKVFVIEPQTDAEGLPVAESQLTVYDKMTELMRAGKVLACYTPVIGGIAEAVLKMAIGNGLAFAYNADITDQDIFGYKYGSFVFEASDDFDLASVAADSAMKAYELGTVTDGKEMTRGEDSVEMRLLIGAYENKLESVYTCNIPDEKGPVKNFEYRAKTWPVANYKSAKPKVIIPAFPGTNCEYDSARAVREAGAEPEIIVIKNRTSDDIKRSVEQFADSVKDAQMIFIPGGFSGGDEPDGSAKFITAFFRNDAVKEQVTSLLDNRDGLMCGICNGFQALIKLGLVPYGKIIDTDENCPTLTFNTIACHQSRIVNVRVASNKSPWLRNTQVGDIYSAPISHGEGRFLASDELIQQLAVSGQIATQYVDMNGDATTMVHFNPNNSAYAIEGITSPDGRVFGKMAHAERVGNGLYKNVPGEYFIKMFESAVRYFK